MKHLTKLVAAAGIVTLALAGCGGGTTSNGGGGASEAKDAATFKACAVSDAGGWDDKSFNESAYNGLKAAQDSLGIQINTAESSSDTDFVPNVEAMVSDGCTLIIGVGFNLEQAIHKSAEQNTDLHYALVDSSFTDGQETVTVENGRPLLFNTAEAAFLAGYAAAGMTKTGKVATFGGMKIPSVTVFMDGFVDGVDAYNKAKGTSVQVLGWDKATQNGSFTQDFDNQTLGKEQAQQFISQGADIIMPVAGPVGLGAAAAAKADGNTWIIGVDSDWYVANPDYSSIVLTSVMKEIGASVEQSIKDSVDGKFSSDPYVGTLANGGVSLAPFHDFDAKVSDELKADLAKLTEDIKTGKLVIESQNAPK
ncbi:BMP family lipoprotein [Schaalia odontolytica]|uniref:BMP family lipoprotein n=1 Tax=Schaalia odontolytica TaxID=1660 RepID=UPI001D0707DD|nr:BMP family ABC transporter substrate-binding protein [Schaalia odontolytica]MCB6402187.1 BMP family ABC transporter substrate-binding protein [Schaalia odontolytica]